MTFDPDCPVVVLVEGSIVVLRIDRDVPVSSLIYSHVCGWVWKMRQMGGCGRYVWGVYVYVRVFVCVRGGDQTNGKQTDIQCLWYVTLLSKQYQYDNYLLHG